MFFGEAVYRVDPATGMIDEPNYTTNVSFPTVAADQDLDGRVYGAYDLNADGSDTHFLHWTVWYDPGGSTVDTGYEGEMGDSVDALCFTPGVFYQRIYGIPVEIDDNGTETVRELIVGPIGGPPIGGPPVGGVAVTGVAIGAAIRPNNRVGSVNRP